MTRQLVLFLLSIALALPATAGFYNVTHFGDSGPGSLRQGILDANSGACARPCRISFQESKPVTINLQSPLPAITANSVRIWGRDFQSYGQVSIIINGRGAGLGDGLRIQGADDVNINSLGFDGFSGNGIVIAESSNIEVACDVTNNGDNGVAIVQSQKVRWGAGVVGGNRTNGIYVTTSNDIEISNSWIGGTDDVAMANGANGIHLHDVKRAQGAFNVIQNNAHAGIVTTGACERIDFEYNHFFRNGLLGIDRGGDGVTAEDTPVIESATYNRGWLRVKGHLRSLPDSNVRILLYTVNEPDPSGYGEGADVILSLTFNAMRLRTDANGNASFVFTVSGDNRRNAIITATAVRVVDERSGQGDVSEFGRNVRVVDDEVEFTVTNTADSGAGSLRAAIEQSNASECEFHYPCEIAFRIAELPPANGVFTIRPRSPLPALRHSHVWLDGETQRRYFGDSNPAGPEIEINGSQCGECNGLEVRPGATKVELLLIRELTINGFSGDGIRVEGPDLTRTATAYIDGCFIGTDPTGTSAVPNGGSGIRIVNAFALTGRWPYYSNRTTAPNLISGNARDGITSETGGFVSSSGNFIGTDISRLYPIANGENGVRTATGSEVRGSTIAFNRGRGVLITEPGHPNFVFWNSIHSNGSLGLDLVTDAPAQNAPEIISASAEREQTRVEFKFDGPPLGPCCAAYLISIYAGSFADATGQGEGKELVFWDLYEGGEPSLNAVILRKFVINRNLAGKFLSATAMRFDRFLEVGLGTTSEFSRAVQVTAPGCPTTAPTLLGPYRWSAVPGVQMYTVWAMKPGDMPRPMFTGTATEAPLQLEAGTEWWVEARFENCYGTQSEHRVAE